MTNLGYIKRMTTDNFKSQNRGGKGIKGMQTINEDYIEDLMMTTTHHYIMFFTNTGKVYRLKGYEIPEASRTSRGTAIINLLSLQPGEKITAVIPIKEYEEGKYLFMATKNGLVKKTSIREYANVKKSGLVAINLRDSDELIEVKYTDDDQDIFLITKYGMCIRFKETDVRATGRASMGVIGMNLTDQDEIVGMQVQSQGEYLLVVSEKGLGKRTDMDEFTVVSYTHLDVYKRQDQYSGGRVFKRHHQVSQGQPGSGYDLFRGRGRASSNLCKEGRCV